MRIADFRTYTFPQNHGFRRKAMNVRLILLPHPTVDPPPPLSSRCSSSGVSGVVTPGGMLTSQAYTGASSADGGGGGALVWTVPVSPRRWTPYVHLGLHYVEWANLVFSAIMWLVLMAAQAWPQV